MVDSVLQFVQGLQRRQGHAGDVVDVGDICALERVGVTDEDRPEVDWPSASGARNIKVWPLAQLRWFGAEPSGASM